MCCQQFNVYIKLLFWNAAGQNVNRVVIILCFVGVEIMLGSQLESTLFKFAIDKIVVSVV